ncbi:MAG: Glycoside hydrolase family 71 protein [Candidatus Woesebacteria bacterium GW2011_GWB1_38_8]|uniref:Glycoside hydrolase family 71 protein n=1 Tax=Candidatus Woesebacteria bacterium GW2011_GWB1_38_8 TaxID=1618570 RepID=A0A0G0LDI4_9BACT|nr:MAG: Glycoside hydrolase family 71 protein [Candidatus Woesebacteria bacterium GW2011_GWB1_38_8]
MSLNLGKTAQNLRNWRSWKKNTQFLAVLVLLFSVLVTTYAVSNFILYLSRAAAAKIYFAPSPLDLPPNSTVSVMIDPADNTSLQGGWVFVEFDQTKVQLTGEIMPNPTFSTIVRVTPMSEANTTGKIEVALGLPPNVPSPTGIMEWAKIPLRAVNTTSSTTNITSNIVNSQLVYLVNGQPQSVALTTTAGIIRLNTLPTPLPTSIVASPTPRPSTTPLPTASVAPTSPTPTSPTGPTVSLTPVADSYVSGSFTTTNWGGSQTLSIDNSPEIKISYLRFDLSSLAGQGIRSAQLRLRVKDVVGSGSTNTQSVKLTDTNWGEFTINYSNRPLPGQSVAVINGGQDGTFITVDVSSAVISKQGQLISFAIDTTGDDGLELFSKEYSLTTHRPTLIVSTTTGPTPIPPTPTRPPNTPTPTLRPPTPTPSVPVQPADTTLSITNSSGSSTPTVVLGQTFTMNINVNTGINSIVGTELYINFDRTRLRAVDIVPGVFFANPVETLERINNTTGTIDYVLHTPPETPAKRGSGILAVMTFEAIGVGSAPITWITGVDGTIIGAINTGARNALKSATGATINILGKQAIPGDINIYDAGTDFCGDGIVNALDYVVLFDNFGEAPTDHPCADINDDGRVNILDYVIMFENWGRTAQ